MENRPQNKGQILKRLRESKGIALETVHESTKIPMDALKAIEEGYTIRTLSSFYYRGFLKIYAQFLKVDVGEVLDDYHPEKIPPPKVEKKESFSAISTFALFLSGYSSMRSGSGLIFFSVFWFQSHSSLFLFFPFFLFAPEQ